MTMPALPHDLLRPEAYAERPSAIELRTTHISWVFLLQRDVYKVKRPVSLGFLEFRTIEERKAACEAEVELNRRISPEVYLGVEPVCVDADGRARIGGGGTVVDWAVHMARLEDDVRGDELLARGMLLPRDIDEVAKRIASFHGNARSDAYTTEFGRASVIRGNVEENFAQTRASLPVYLGAEEAEEIVRYQSSFLRDHEALFAERGRAGRVRDGHGDLRLEHIYFEPSGGVTILDCIEFNERFRFADVCADVAFLSMDLASHGRVDLAERFLATYARETNDFDMYALVDFYESYRAFVRGKIATMVAGDASGTERDRKRAGDEARRHLLLALSAGRRSLLSPSVVAVGGIIASGKSTIADRVGFEMSAPVIEADRTRKGMLGVTATQSLSDPAFSGAYDPTFTDRVYAEVLRRAEVVLASGRPVVLDASFRSKAMRGAARELAERHGVPYRFVECRAPADACRARLLERERTRSVSDGRLAIFDAFCARFEAVTEILPSEHIVLDTTQLPETSLATLRERLDTWPRGLT